MRRVRLDKNRVEWPGLVLQATWRGGMLAARISALVLFALAFNYWILAVMGIICCIIRRLSNFSNFYLYQKVCIG